MKFFGTILLVGFAGVNTHAADNAAPVEATNIVVITTNLTNRPVAEAPTNSPTLKPATTNYYTCAMHPEVRSTDPDGKCPICQMQLFPVEEISPEPKK